MGQEPNGNGVWQISRPETGVGLGRVGVCFETMMAVLRGGRCFGVLFLCSFTLAYEVTFAWVSLF